MSSTPSEIAARIALVSLSGLGPARLRWLLSGCSAVVAVDHLRTGRLPPVAAPAPSGVTRTLVHLWTDQLRRRDPEALLEANSVDGTLVLDPDHRLWPFVDDPEPPALLFARGDPELLVAGALVAIVGTRRCTSVGRQVATELGAQLTEAGVVVVSGLASGIDGCAHQGVLAAGGRPIAVVGTGLDVVYPAANRGLWFRTAEQGLLLSEAPMGTRPERWRFPARNRLIAGLADAVVVVESHTSGGSMHTVNEAADRGRLVMAVPGAITNPAAAGTNQLLAEGCPPVTGAHDVIEALGLSPATPAADRPQPSEPSSLRGRIRAEVATGAIHVDELIAATVGSSDAAASIRRVLAAVNELVAQGEVVLDGSTVSLRQQPPL